MNMEDSISDETFEVSGGGKVKMAGAMNIFTLRGLSAFLKWW